jgi:lipid-A-disaccharide synthase
MTNDEEILIIAGEISGDLIGAGLVEQLKKKNPRLKVSGIGGEKMKSAGMDLIFHINQMAFLGFWEVLKHYPFIRKVRNKILERVADNKIKYAVLIDYPGFNLNITPKLKKLGVKIFYYVSPQLWAWGSGRVKKIQKFIEKMLVIFPFEKDFYKKLNVDVEFVGHPLIERVSSYSFLSRDELFEKLNLEKGKEILLLLPGSRKQEIERIFPETIKAAKKLADKFNLQIVVACSSNINKKIFDELAAGIKFNLASDLNYELMKYSKFGIIKSGTSTLEAGYFSLPMVVVYKTSVASYLIGSNLIKIDKIAMANIILGEKVVPELIQSEVNEKNVFEQSKKILSDDSEYGRIKASLGNIKNQLGEAGASEKAAKSILALMNES